MTKINLKNQLINENETHKERMIELARKAKEIKEEMDNLEDIIISNMIYINAIGTNE
jgi:hypothetical protein